MERYPKGQRQRIVRELINAGAVHTQEELADLLAARGVPVTQATVSRDLVEVGAATRLEGARRRLRMALAEAPGELGAASSILVFRTAPGLANMVAIALDACGYPEIVGTVAGDDTIFIALRSPDDRPAVEAILHSASATAAADD